MTIALKQFTKIANAGDAASSMVVGHLAGEAVSIIGPDDVVVPNLIAIGSILHWADAATFVWGAGLISPTIRLRVKPRAILATRGHLTRQRLASLGIECPDVVGDPGIFLPELFPPAVQKHALGIVPHYVDRDEPFVARARERGGIVIDSALPVSVYVARLTSCCAIASSSLHGLIFAHAYGIPAVWARLSDKVHGDGFKFADYYSSVGVSHEAISTCGPDASPEQAVQLARLPDVQVDKERLRDALFYSLALIRLSPGAR